MDFPPNAREQGRPEHDGVPVSAETRKAPLNSFADQYNNPGPRPVLVAAESPSRLEIWAHRLSLVVFVIFCVWIGMLLVVLPWTPAWTQNNFLVRYPAIRNFLSMNFVRGIASGLGLIDIWVGIWQAVHYRER